jgi:hypothetical protein
MNALTHAFVNQKEDSVRNETLVRIAHDLSFFEMPEACIGGTGYIENAHLLPEGFSLERDRLVVSLGNFRLTYQYDDDHPRPSKAGTTEVIEGPVVWFQRFSAQPDPLVPVCDGTSAYSSSGGVDELVAKAPSMARDLKRPVEVRDENWSRTITFEYIG